MHEDIIYNLRLNGPMNYLHYLYKRLSIIDVLNFLILAVVVAIYIVTFNNTPYRWNLLFIYPALFIYLILMIYWRQARMPSEWKRRLMFINPIIFLFSIFESFYMLLPYFNSVRYDAILEKLDFAILGVSPTIWIEQFASPFLTDILYLFYFFYFPMPLILLGWMLWKGKYKEIERAMFIFLFCYYGAYITYFFVPARGPRFFLQDQYSVPLNGYFLAQAIHGLIDTLEPNKLDAFPSLHTAILITTMVVSYQYNRKMFYWFIPAAVGILISLIYCRYHYFIDMLAGLVWSIIAVLLASYIYKSISSRFVHHFTGQD